MGTRRRLSTDESREQLLAAGAQIFYRDPVRAGLDRIKVTDVVGDLGLTTGAFYHHWDGIGAYREDLVGYLVSSDRFPTGDLVLADLVAFIKDLTYEEAITVIATVAWDGLTADPAPFRAFLAIWLLDGEPARRSTRAQYDHEIRTWTTVLEVGFALFQREPVAPWTTDELAVALTALIDGYFLRAAVEPDEPGAVPPFVAAAEHLLLTGTRPVTDG